MGPIHSGRTAITMAAMLGFAVLGGCGEATGGDSSGMAAVRDSAGVRVITNSGPAWAPGSAWELVEDLRVGRVDGTGPDVFGRIEDLAVDDEGRIYVLDGLAFEVRVFGPDGVHSHSFGGSGEGPGEFARPVALSVDPEGDVWVVDTRNRRYLVFQAGGTHLHDLPRFGDLPACPWPGAFLSDGRVVEASSDPDLQAPGSGILTLHLPDGQLVDTVRTPEFEPGFVTVATPGAIGGARYTLPFQPSLATAWDPDGRLVASITDRYLLATIDPGTGDTLRVVSLERDPLPVLDEEADRALEGFARLGGIDRELVPSSHPFIAPNGIVVDQLGFLWVRPMTRADISTGEGWEPPPRRFDVFDDEGRYLGQLSTGIILHGPVITATHIYGWTEDELGVDHVVRIRIEGR